MSEVSEAAHVTIFIADYSAVGQDGKVGAIGVGWQITQAIVPTPVGPGLPMHYVTALVEVPQVHAGKQVALTLTLRNASGDPILAPAPEGVEPQPLRLGQLAVLQRPQVNGVYVPETVPCRVNMSLGVPAGLAVPLGETYAWTLDIDDEARDDWRASFFVVPPQPGPVFG